MTTFLPNTTGPASFEQPTSGCDTSGAGAPSQVEITNFADIPLGLDIGSTTAFCVYDATGVLIGKTFLVTQVDENTGAQTHEELFLSTAANAVPVPWANQGDKRECDPCNSSGDNVQGFQGA